MRITRTVQEYIETTTNDGLKILHSIVTCNKHVTVSKPVYHGSTDPQLEDNISNIVTEDGKIITNENGSPLVTEESNIMVNFGDRDAISVLKSALAEFT